MVARLENAGLWLRHEKCQFIQTSVEYLGYTIDADGLYPTAKKVAAICQAPQPHDVTTLKSYLGTFLLQPIPATPANNPEPTLYTITAECTLHGCGQIYREREAFEASKRGAAQLLKTATAEYVRAK